MSFRYLFGPVLSRRLGHSLGVDLLPYKTCTYDCIYCELGRTTCLRVEREAFVPPEEAIEELERFLEVYRGPLDWVTFSGSGEPLLCRGIGRIISHLRRRVGVPVAVLTNGALLWDPEVQEEVMEADVVLPSLDAASPAVFSAINRPHGSLSLERVLGGLEEFRRRFPGQVWLEVMLCRGMNDDPRELARLREAIGRLRPHRVQLNTVVRPPAEEYAWPVSPERLRWAAELLGGEVVGEAEAAGGVRVPGEVERQIEHLVRRRPCTLEDIARTLGAHPAEVVKHLDRLRQAGVLRCRVHDRRVYWEAAHAQGQTR